MGATARLLMSITSTCGTDGICCNIAHASAICRHVYARAHVNEHVDVNLHGHGNRWRGLGWRGRRAFAARCTKRAPTTPTKASPPKPLHPHNYFNVNMNNCRVPEQPGPPNSGEAAHTISPRGSSGGKRWS